MLKYKRRHRDRGGDSNHFIYDDQAEVLEFCFGPGDLAAQLGGENVNAFRSVECQIMDLADDIAYSCFDIVDGVNARFLTPARLVDWGDSAKLDDLQRGYLRELVTMIREERTESRMSRVVGELIKSSSLVPRENFMSQLTRRHTHGVAIEAAAQARIKLHKRISRDLVFGATSCSRSNSRAAASSISSARPCWGTISKRIRNPSALLPANMHRSILACSDEAGRARLVCDYISGMTDAYALRSYKRLLDPDYGSISELI